MELQKKKINEELTYLLYDNRIVGTIRKNEEDYACIGWINYHYRKKANTFEEACQLSEQLMKRILEHEKRNYLTIEEIRNFTIDQLERAETFIIMEDSLGASTMNVGYDFVDSLKDSVEDYGTEGIYMINLSGFRLHIVQYKKESSMKNSPKMIGLWHYCANFNINEERVKITCLMAEENEALACMVFNHLMKNFETENNTLSFQKYHSYYERSYEYQIEAEIRRKSSYMQYKEVFLKEYDIQKALNQFEVKQMALVKRVDVNCNVYYEKYKDPEI